MQKSRTARASQTKPRIEVLLVWLGCSVSMWTCLGLGANGEKVHPALACWPKVSVGLLRLQGPHDSLMVSLPRLFVRVWFSCAALVASVWRFFVSNSTVGTSLVNVRVRGAATL